ncbi:MULTISPECIES: isochorismate synthase MenF [unclassified Prochlorococcus]|uniref:isochorismate synthase n=1 Tax=unclassified Prochlorococcus TaxID=2627481 RepID=UPI000533792C|nr:MULTISPECIES: isochorismate synthase [unclassified Prochlorococcus]KGG16760.1 Isochorismate synthase Menaquinone-specific isochorismate synthase [Prochlorococcus sp. MIT 0602]KGG18266.1 Isochorismate synthase Menaquinone-specific isochorismate synthase [Prochlorococcus sp. MIT 0603]
MKTGLTFSETLQASLRGWSLRRSDECVLSLALPINTIDPLHQLTVISHQLQFSFLWDQSPGLSIAAAGQCQNFELIGQRRFELAERFSHETLSRLIDVSPHTPIHAKPKILFAFTFFEQAADGEIAIQTRPAVQAVLPRWQLTCQAGRAYLRFNAVVADEAGVRDFVEQFWLMREKLSIPISGSEQLNNPKEIDFVIPEFQEWEESYRLALIKGIDLVDSGQLKKLVLAVRQSVILKKPLNPLVLLASLRKHQRGSCRFLWKRFENESFFGASPERLLSLKQGNLQTDALAGTAGQNDEGVSLLNSEKNLREHELVVSSIKKQLIDNGLDPNRLRHPRLARHGHLIHLHTPIKAHAQGLSAIQLVEILHPTPAVAGLPRGQSIQWLRTLEPFDRGCYAAPIGWVDNSGNAEFRVAIRCAYTREKHLHLMAGAGLVKGSSVESELHEVKLKLMVLADQLNLHFPTYGKSFSRRSIT